MPTGFPKIPRPVKLTRVCSTCKDEKPNTEEFFPRRSQKVHRLGLQSACKECHNTRTKKRFALIRLEALQHYSSGDPRCACCGESQVEFLGLDHIEGGGGKQRREVKGAMYQASWLRKQGYPSGIQVLCHNCNLAKGFYGVCPHQR